MKDVKATVGDIMQLLGSLKDATRDPYEVVNEWCEQVFNGVVYRHEASEEFVGKAIVAISNIDLQAGRDQWSITTHSE
jgi:hypothetical protein